MTNPAQHFKLVRRNRPRGRALAVALLWALTMVAMQPAQAQNFTVLHNFTGGSDGAYPSAGLTSDSAGNLYGTTYGTTQYGGVDYGTVFKLARHGSGWLLVPLYTFQGGNDGAVPAAEVIFGPDGALYGTTIFGGGGACRSGTGVLGCGTVFRLVPPSTPCRTTSCPWTETILYRFQAGSDASNPVSRVTFDHSGKLYGTTDSGGTSGHGTVYELQHSNGSWSESILYSFSPGPDGMNPAAEVLLDGAGNLYGTAPQGGQGCSGLGCGVVYELSHSPNGWTETVLYSFSGGNDGGDPYGGLIFDAAGNLYGTTLYGGTNNPGGTVFELTPSNGSWTFTTLYSLYGNQGPVATLAMDRAGNLYGTASGDPSGSGSAFELERSGGSWTFNELHVFGGSDGAYVYGAPLVDSAGNVYGTANAGGESQNCIGGGCGTAWEITH